MTLVLSVYHNVSSDRMRFFEGYKPEDPLTHVFDLAVPDHIDLETNYGVDTALDYAFMALNVGHEDFAVITDEGKANVIAYRERKNRSLSVGDVIIIDGVAFACAALGWGVVTVHPHQIIADYAEHGTTSLDKVKF